MTEYRGRRAFEISNGQLTVTVMREGGHIARIVDHATGVNPLWTPPWPTIEPSTFVASRDTQYGTDSEAKLLSGLMGHNLCVDLFGAPTEAEAAAGMTVHGESSVVPYECAASEHELVLTATFPQAAIAFERRVGLRGNLIVITETAENLSACDRPSAWTQHVTLGPPFIEQGVTRILAPATRSKVYETDFTEGIGKQEIGAVFDWPLCPRSGGGHIDLRTFEAANVSAGYTTHLMDPSREQAFFLTYHPGIKLLFGYAWPRADFPWLGRWEENNARTSPPWNGHTVALGLEFGASPMPETRRAMIERGSLFGAPGYRWLPARQKVTVRYCAFAQPAASMPGEVAWDGESGLRFSG